MNTISLYFSPENCFHSQNPFKTNDDNRSQYIKQFNIIIIPSHVIRWKRYYMNAMYFEIKMNKKRIWDTHHPFISFIFSSLFYNSRASEIYLQSSSLTHDVGTGGFLWMQVFSETLWFLFNIHYIRDFRGLELVDFFFLWNRSRLRIHSIL